MAENGSFGPTQDCPVSFNVSTALAVMAAQHPEGKAIVYRAEGAWRSRTYRQLEADTAVLARGLERAGIRRRTRTVLMVPPGPELFALTFALLRVGAVPVLVDPGLGVRALGRCLTEAEPLAFIGGPKAHLARLLFGWARRTLRVRVTVGPRCWGGVTLAEVRRLGETSVGNPNLPSGADDPAAILFTSGSTGSPKGAVYTHGMFAAQVALLRSRFGIRSGEVDLATFPLFGLFSPALGMTAVIPEMDFTRPGAVDPLKILGPLWQFGATTLFGSPALLDRVSRFAEERQAKVPALRRVICAGAPVPAKVLERCAKMLAPEAEILTPYGATEALPVTVIGHREILAETRALTDKGRGACVGRPLPGLRVAVIGITDGAIERWSESLAVPQGEIGEIAVKGLVVSAAYYGRPGETMLAKILDAGEPWHRMGDVGYFDGEGRLWFCGRKSQRVVTGEGTLFTIPVEGVFNAHRDVRRSALVGVGPAGAQTPVLCVEPEARVRDLETLKAELLAIGRIHAHTRGIQDILFHKSFPVDIRHNAKIFREQLAVWAQRELE